MSASVTLVGRLGADPELRFGASGMPILKARLVTSGRKKDPETDKWIDVDTTWWAISAFREMAESAAESLRKGDEIIVVGKMKSREYETPEGEKRSVFEVTADHIGPSLRRATCSLNRIQRSSSTGEGRAAFEQAKQQLDDPWTTKLPDEEVPF